MHQARFDQFEPLEEPQGLGVRAGAQSLADHTVVAHEVTGVLEPPGRPPHEGLEEPDGAHDMPEEVPEDVAPPEMRQLVQEDGVQLIRFAHEGSG